MPLVKANEPMPPRPIIVTIYGDPGIGKTALVNTSKHPVNINADKGADRSILRKDTLDLDTWQEVIKFEKDGFFKDYSTIGIDTPKALLDDFLMSHVVSQDPKLRNNKLWAYGAIGDEFKLFINNRRRERADLVNICHAKKDDDTKRMMPDVTGQSLQLLLRVSDVIGYYTMFNGRRMLFFDPSETTIGKNVAQLAPIEVPDASNPAFRTFLADLIEQIRAAIASHSEEQLEALQKSEEYQNLVHGCTDPDSLTTVLKDVNTLPDYLKIPLQKVVMAKAKEKGWVANKETMKYEATASPAAGATPLAGQPSGETGRPAAGDVANPATIATSYDDRLKQLDAVGLVIELDRVVGYGLQFSHDTIGEWSENQYLDAVASVNEAKKTFNKNGSKKRALAGAR